MKPFNNIAVSPTQPENKADVWIKHNYIKYNGGWQNITYGTSGEVQSNSKRLASDKIKLEKGVYKLDNPNNEEISPVAIAKFNEDSFVELKANIKFPYELVIDDTFNQVSVVFKKANETVITSGDVKNFEILSLQEDDILVNDNGVYNSVLNRKNAISLGIKEQVNITQKGLRTPVPMDNPSVKIGETFELLSDGTIKILKNTIIFAFAQTQLIINDTDTGRLYIEKNGDGICAEEGKGTKAYQAMGIFNVNVGDIIRVTVVNVTAGRGNTGTTVSFNHLDMYEI